MMDQNGSFLKVKKNINLDQFPGSPISPVTNDKLESNLKSELTLKQKVEPVEEKDLIAESEGTARGEANAKNN